MTNPNDSAETTSDSTDNNDSRPFVPRRNSDSWEGDQTFSVAIADPTGQVVPEVECEAVATVNRAVLPNGRIKFSYSVGFKRVDNSRPGQFFPIIARGMGKVTILDPSPAIALVSKAASEYIAGELQKQEDERMSLKLAQEAKRQSYTLPPAGQVQRHPATVRKGKTERDKNKGKQEDLASLKREAPCDGPTPQALLFIR